jgi:hypothetical protein
MMKNCQGSHFLYGTTGCRRFWRPTPDHQFDRSAWLLMTYHGDAETPNLDISGITDERDYPSGSRRHLEPTFKAYPHPGGNQDQQQVFDHQHRINFQRPVDRTVSPLARRVSCCRPRRIDAVRDIIGRERANGCIQGRLSATPG